jgi:serine/threonine-protein phosphatase CPPED1
VPLEIWMERRVKFLIAIALVAVLALVVLYSSNVNDGTVGWNYQQMSLFSHSESNFTFTFSGDERDDNGNFSKMINNINSNYSNLLFNINGGDLKSDALQLGDFKKEYLTPGNTAHFNRPVLFVIGNHELQGDPSGSEIYQKIFGNPTYYNFTEKNSYFIVIDNANGEVDSKQVAWLEDQLNRSQKFKYRFVFMHVPLYSPNSGEEGAMITTGLVGADVLRTLFDANNVTMIFASHIHNYYTGTWGKTPFIISGGAGAPPEEYYPPNHHYIIVNVTDNNVTYTKIPY